jgi:hypothetical protein
MGDWVAEELGKCEFPDLRLGRRLEQLVGQFAAGLGESIPMACQDWAATKAAYRFFSNDRVNKALILRGHFEATRARFASTSGPILVLQDTTEFTFRREEHSAIGCTGTIQAGHSSRPRLHTVCGILMHGSLVTTPEGLPLGLSAIKFWTRKKFKGTNALKRLVNPTRVPIEEKESYRWIQSLRASCELLGDPSRLVHIGDRESDIYELFCAAQESGSHFLVRTCVDRLAQDGTVTVSKIMEEVRVKGLHRIEVPASRGQPSSAVLELRYRRIRILPPIGKQRRYPAMVLTVLHAKERGTPQGRPPIEWKLLTDLPIRNRQEAIEKLRWYARRWQVETYHKVLKSGCGAESLRHQTAERLTNAIAVFCILAWRILWMTTLNREQPNAPASHAFTKLELRILDQLVPAGASQPAKAIVSTYLLKLARLGGYLARARDGPPGNTVIWRGLSRLSDIELGASLGRKSVGN